MSDDLSLNDEVRAAWDELAGFWDDAMEAGTTWQRHLIQPSVERLLRLRPHERVLEIACGNGEFARRMSELGGIVLATDFSEAMLDRARSRGGDIEYRSADATNAAALLALGELGSFDAVVINMAIMDMESIEPMAAATAQLLKPSGRFVFSTLHPAFNSGDARPTVEIDPEGNSAEVYSVRVSSYGQSATSKGVGIVGQPVEQWYFHRPLWMVFEPFFAHGFALDGLEESRDAWKAHVRLHTTARGPRGEDAPHRVNRSTAIGFRDGSVGPSLLTRGRHTRAQEGTRRHRTTRGRRIRAWREQP